MTFASEEAAQTCIETLNSTEIDGNIIKMNIARGKQGKEVSNYWDILFSEVIYSRTVSLSPVSCLFTE